MLTLSEKKALFDTLTARVEHEFQTLLAAHRATQEGATHEEAKPENDKDTRALEQSYLARGQAKRVAELKVELHHMQSFALRAFDQDTPIGLGALIRTEDAHQVAHWYFLTPSGAGETLKSKIGPIKIVTPGSPLGRALLGARVDDDIETTTPTGKRILCITAVC